MTNGAMIAAAEIQRQHEEEEHSRSQTSRSEGLEYKILRATIPSFGKSENLQKALDEEAKNGWELLEKFDNYRIRLVRKVGEQHPNSGIDPYRAFFGMSQGWFVAVILIAVFGFIFGFTGLIVGLSVILGS